MYRFFCLAKDVSGDRLSIFDKKQNHHLKNVLRLKPGDRIAVCDEKGHEYISKIEESSENETIAKITEKRISKGKKILIAVACAIPKKSKMDEIIDKLTQLGVDVIMPMETKRVIVKLDPAKRESKLRRWREIALNASQQSQRKTPPLIEPVKPIQIILSEAKDYDVKLIPTLIGKRTSLRQACSGSSGKNILILIGPEGDFTEEEVGLAVVKGCIPVDLGDLVLRVDTAAIAAASYLRLSA